jgi:hypothetical protein
VAVGVPSHPSGSIEINDPDYGERYIHELVITSLGAEALKLVSRGDSSPIDEHIKPDQDNPGWSKIDRLVVEAAIKKPKPYRPFADPNEELPLRPPTVKVHAFREMVPAPYYSDE